MARRKQREKVSLTSEPPAGGFGDLLRARGLRASAPATPPPEVATAPSAPRDALDRVGRLTLRKERKGRKGKTVTLIDGFSDSEGLPELASRIARALGCGCVPESTRLVVQGDQRERLRTWLRQSGVSEVRG